MKRKSARRDANFTEFVRNRGDVLAPDALCNIRQLAERKNISVLLDRKAQHEDVPAPTPTASARRRTSRHTRLDALLVNAKPLLPEELISCRQLEMFPLLLNMTARFPTIGLSFFLLTAFLQRFYFCQIVSRIAVVRVDPQCRFEFFYRLGNSTHQCQSGSQVTVRVGRIRIHAQGLLIMVDCL